MKCAHCDKPGADNTWDLWACADSRKHRKKHLCDKCDIKLNTFVLKFFGDTNARHKMEKYAKRVKAAIL